MLLELLQGDWDCLEKKNSGVEELVRVLFVMEHPHCLKARSLLWLGEVILLLRKLCTWLNMLVMFTYLFVRTILGHRRQCKIGKHICTSATYLLKLCGGIFAVCFNKCFEEGMEWPSLPLFHSFAWNIFLFWITIPTNSHSFPNPSYYPFMILLNLHLIKLPIYIYNISFRKFRASLLDTFVNTPSLSVCVESELERRKGTLVIHSFIPFIGSYFCGWNQSRNYDSIPFLFPVHTRHSYRHSIPSCQAPPSKIHYPDLTVELSVAF